LQPGDIQANGLALVQYEAAAGKFRLLSMPANPALRFGKTAGTGAAYTLATSPVLTALFNGAVVLAHVHATNTGGATLAVDATPATAVKKWGGGALVAGDLLKDSLAVLEYNNELAGWLLAGSLYDAPTIQGATTSAGSPTAYALTAPGPPSYTSGLKFRLKLDATNTGAATFEFTPTGGSGLGAVAIKKFGTVPVATGDLVSGRIVELVHDGTNFQMLGQPGTEGQRFISAEVAAPAVGAGITPIAHGLGGYPVFFRAVAKVNDAGGDAGYADNDEVEISSFFDSAGGDSLFSAAVDASNIHAGTKAGASPRVIGKTGTSSVLTLSKWNLKFYLST
jgi:hypothetical protein